ncbi:MAG: hypothetical protein AAGF83_09615 [Cyanobacteria bacterium P01_G01_bin.67]
MPKRLIYGYYFSLFPVSWCAMSRGPLGPSLADETLAGSHRFPVPHSPYLTRVLDNPH